MVSENVTKNNIKIPFSYGYVITTIYFLKAKEHKFKRN